MVSNTEPIADELNNSLHLARLSQSQLNILEKCPRRFQHIYFEHLASPIGLEQQEKQNWGSRFHLLMQQRELGLPIESIVAEDPQLQKWLTDLVSATPEIWTPEPNSFRQAEHCRTLNFQGYLLTVIYDLLIAGDRQAEIFDWKTYPQPKQQYWLAHDWQTRLYLYVLAETSDYLPEQISMTYWFVQSQPKPQSLKFPYDRKQHQQTQADLINLLTKLTYWLELYQKTGQNFPQVAETSGYCRFCNFAVRCQRTPESRELASNTDLISLATIGEVVL